MNSAMEDCGNEPRNKLRENSFAEMFPCADARLSSLGAAPKSLSTRDLIFHGEVTKELIVLEQRLSFNQARPACTPPRARSAASAITFSRLATRSQPLRNSLTSSTRCADRSQLGQHRWIGGLIETMTRETRDDQSRSDRSDLSPFASSEQTAP